MGPSPLEDETSAGDLSRPTRQVEIHRCIVQGRWGGGSDSSGLRVTLAPISSSIKCPLSTDPVQDWWSGWQGGADCEKLPSLPLRRDRLRNKNQPRFYHRRAMQVVGGKAGRHLSGDEVWRRTRIDQGERRKEEQQTMAWRPECPGVSRV